MTKLVAALPRPRILYSCYANATRQGEQFVAEHTLSFQLAGTLRLHDGTSEQTIGEGQLHFSQRNRLVRFHKQLSAQGEFKAVSIQLDQATLRMFARTHGYGAGSVSARAGAAVVVLPLTALYRSFLASLQPYEQLAQAGHEALLALKVQEALWLLFKSNPELHASLLDFTAPGKLDLAAFMRQHFHFNVALAHFAYLTGRSLATFKRDFAQLFHQSPGRWLHQRRLEEAHYLIQVQGRSPVTVYLEVGFEDLSHFSFAFKKKYGVAPSQLGRASSG